MIEQLISFETAKLAKEKNCTLDLYEELEYEYENEYGDTFVCNFVPEMNDKIFNVRRKINCTQSLLQRWLRESHEIDTGLYYWDDGSYSYKIQKLIGIKKMFYYTDDVWIGNYEDTLEHALVKALEIIEE